MTITFKLYATLMGYLPAGTKGHAVELHLESVTTVQQLIDRFNIPDDLAFLVMLNGIYLQPEERPKTNLKASDVLAIWPKVAGG